MPIADLVDLCAPENGVATSPPPSVCIYQRDAPSALEAYLYEPVLCVVLQGAKMMRSGDHAVQIAAGDALVVSHHLPVISLITKASMQSPYLAIVLSLNVATLRELYAQIENLPKGDTEAGAISCRPAEAGWIEPLHRYLAMANDPTAMAVLGSQLLREIQFRLLISPTGALLRNRLATDSYANRISRSINTIRAQLSATMRVPDLAEQIGMSSSAFHSHFKSVTGATPLQFQKELRLIKAKDLLEDEGRSVAAAAYEVGYESPTHFSRDFKRKFGHNPSRSKPGVTVEVASAPAQTA